ncbi:hypothetical protein L0B53_14005 [Vibrio sp. SS-MA-C1-2]|uniref:hypothetical protein n=1 Tax=Vibrio sp. SS-MA-C1-2 TaxID=2908646 RepID=UPI001F2D3C49|nr:hypothetical protein [Vibrio sp. SS-MA-C1-2]UJF18126.1 hypothetical protein L0B53_14005 [Vibrio sp. SS-MA-C1-2]
MKKHLKTKIVRTFILLATCYSLSGCVIATTSAIVYYKKHHPKDVNLVKSQQIDPMCQLTQKGNNTKES